MNVISICNKAQSLVSTLFCHCMCDIDFLGTHIDSTLVLKLGVTKITIDLVKSNTPIRFQIAKTWTL